MSSIISVENLGKKYRLQHQSSQQPYVALRDVLTDCARNLVQRVIHPVRSSHSSHPSQEDFWALKDVFFDVKAGDRVGIIGRNGAGKSTLLKVLSRITEPTTGVVRIKGRVASLLEVGTGFHPELTGRENVFLNGAILGMSRTEIKKKFDEIVDFAEIEKFLDTPVKRYSSGMYVRLAFAVAAHLEPEILIVDEVLAVGDAQFQKKCLGKMEAVSAKEGRTVLFVSHNMQAITALCDRAILLNHGSVIEDGATRDVTIRYLNIGDDAYNVARRDLTNPRLRQSKISNPDSVFKWTEILIYNSKKENTNDICYGEPFEVVIRGYSTETCENIRVGMGVISKQFGMVFTTHQQYSGLSDRIDEGHSEYRIMIDPNYLVPGLYSIGIAAGETVKIADYILDDAITFTILNIPHFADRQWNSIHQGGVVFFPCTWKLNSGNKEKP